MRRTNRTGNFFTCLLVNMLLNLEWSIPAWILLALHFIFGLSIVFFFVAIAVWILVIIFWMKVIGWASNCETKPTPKNINPYSSTGRIHNPVTPQQSGSNEVKNNEKNN